MYNMFIKSKISATESCFKMTPLKLQFFTVTEVKECNVLWPLQMINNKNSFCLSNQSAYVTTKST